MIKFLHPEMLYGLFALAIPLVIHLFNFRRYRTVRFSNVALLKEVQSQTRRQSRLKHLIVLFTRMLLITALVLAFARPVIPGKTPASGGNTGVVAVFVDNSLSMQRTGGDGTLFDKARARAVDLTDVYGDRVQYLLLGNNSTAGRRTPLSRSEFLDALAETEPALSGKGMNEILGSLKFLKDEDYGNITAWVLSDFQTSMLDTLTRSIANTTAQIYLVPVPAIQTGNIFIDSAWFTTPSILKGLEATLVARLRNSAQAPAEAVPVRVFIEGVQKVAVSVDIPAGGYADVPVKFIPSFAGRHHAVIETDDPPVPYDNRLYLSFPVSEPVRIAMISAGDPNLYLKRLWSRDDAFLTDLIREGSYDFNELWQYNLIVLDEVSALSTGQQSLLHRFLLQQGDVLLIPPAGEMDVSLQAFLDTVSAGRYAVWDSSGVRLGRIHTSHRLFSEVFEKEPSNLQMPVVKGYYPHRIAGLGAAEPVLSLENDYPLLVDIPVESHHLFLMTTPLRLPWCDLPLHPVFVPLFYNMAIQSFRLPPLYQVLGNEMPFTVSASDIPGDGVLEIVDEEKGVSVIPLQRRFGNMIQVNPSGSFDHPGFYTVQYNGKPEMLLAANLNRDESLLSFAGEATLKKWAEENGNGQISLFAGEPENFSARVASLNDDRQLADLFLWIALALLLAEALLLRFANKE